MRVEGREHLQGLEGPVIFAANHQSHMDGPVIMAALAGAVALPRWRRRWPRSSSRPISFRPSTDALAWFTNSLNYYLAALFFNAFPLPQREAGARQTLRYIGDVLEDGFSVLIFPEGRRTDTGEIERFRPGIGMIASRLGVPVVPVRIDGLDRVLHHTWRMARPGPRPGRLRRAAAPRRRRLRSAGQTGRRRGEETLNLIIWSSGYLVIDWQLHSINGQMTR